MVNTLKCLIANSPSGTNLFQRLSWREAEILTPISYVSGVFHNYDIKYLNQLRPYYIWYLRFFMCNFKMGTYPLKFKGQNKM